MIVRCEPEKAFALVSDPRNWPRYLPEMAVREPLDVPLHAGSIIHVTVTLPTTSLAADERVTEYEPGRKFGTAIVGATGDGVYEFTRVGEGTEVAYTAPPR